MTQRVYIDPRRVANPRPGLRKPKMGFETMKTSKQPSLVPKFVEADVHYVVLACVLFAPLLCVRVAHLLNVGRHHGVGEVPLDDHQSPLSWKLEF